MYCVGHNENFGNHRSTDPEFVTGPATPRLIIGLAHSGNETDDQRKDVDFDAYRIRITDADGDALPEADDAATVPSSYGARDWDHDGNHDTPVDRGISWTNWADVPTLPGGWGPCSALKPKETGSRSAIPGWGAGIRSASGQGRSGRGGAASAGGGLWNVGAGFRRRGATGSAGRRCPAAAG